MSLTAFAQQHHVEPIADAAYSAHLPPSVLASLPSSDCIVFQVPDEYSDTAAFSEHFGFGLDDCANTLILRYTRDKVDHHVAVVTLGSRRLDINGAVKAFLSAKRVSFAQRDVATEISGMAFGGITAVGLPVGFRVLIDAAVMQRQFVVIGAGVRETKILLSPAALCRASGGEVAELTLAGA